MDDTENIPDSGNQGSGAGSPGNTPITIVPPVKRGRGRPPGSGKKTEPQSSSRPAAGKSDETIDAATFGELAVKLCEIGDDLCVSFILSRARQKLDEVNYERFRGYMGTINLKEREKELLKSSFIALAKRYDFLLRWGPEIMVMVVGVQYGTRMGVALKKIESLPDPKASAAPTGDKSAEKTA